MFLDALTVWKSATVTTKSTGSTTSPNSSTMACRLPIELLQTIFLLLAAESQSHAPGHSHGHTNHHPLSSPPPPSRPSWIPITHVCAYWRASALGLRELWSVIGPGLSIAWAQAMMERSAPLPVHVDIRISCSTTNSNSSTPNAFSDGFHPLAASELLFAASRIRTLRLAGLRSNVQQVLNRLRSPSRHLESLTLSIYDGGGPPVVLPAALFGGRESAAPCLRRLAYATDTCIEAPLWLMRGITEFTTGADVSLLEMLETLRAMPQLQVLRVQHCRAVWEDDDEGGGGGVGGDGRAPSGPRRIVTLPHLRLIAFRDTTPRRFVLLVPRIDAPSTVRRCLYWRSWAVASWERWRGMLDDMRAFVPRDSVLGAGDGGLRKVRVRGGPARGSFTVWSRSASTLGGEDGEGEEDTALFVFRIDWKGSPVDPLGQTLFDHSSPFFHLAALCRMLMPAMRVSDLAIEPEPELGADTDISASTSASSIQWESLLGALESVQTLRLHGDEIASSVLNSLLSSSTASESESGSGILLPRLQRLYVVQCDVGSRGAAQVQKRSGRRWVHQAHQAAASADGSGGSGGSAFWRTLPRFALPVPVMPGGVPEPASHGGGRALVARGVGVGHGLVELGRSRLGIGIEVVLVHCTVDRDSEVLDELRKCAQVSFGDEWVYV